MYSKSNLGYANCIRVGKMAASGDIYAFSAFTGGFTGPRRGRADPLDYLLCRRAGGPKRPRPDAGRAPSKHLAEVCYRARTGDLFLFSSKHRSSDITKFFTNSVWDHVALVVRPRGGGPAYALEWCAGLVASPLRQRLSDYAELDAREICFRPLVLAPELPRARLEAMIEEFTAALLEQQMGSNSVIPFGQVLPSH